MNLWLYLLSTICAHSCNFPTPQDMIMKITGKRITAMSTRFGVNQSTVSLCGASVESVVYFMLSFLYETMWYIIFRYVINTVMVHLRFVYLYVRLFLGYIWVFYASYLTGLKCQCPHRVRGFRVEKFCDTETRALVQSCILCVSDGEKNHRLRYGV